MRWKRIVKIGVVSVAGLVLLLGIAGLLYERSARSAALRDFPPPGRLIELDTHALHIDCRGEGAPTIVLEAGMDPFGSASSDMLILSGTIEDNVFEGNTVSGSVLAGDCEYTQ